MSMFRYEKQHLQYLAIREPIPCKFDVKYISRVNREFFSEPLSQFRMSSKVSSSEIQFSCVYFQVMFNTYEYVFMDS